MKVDEKLMKIDEDSEFWPHGLLMEQDSWTKHDDAVGYSQKLLVGPRRSQIPSNDLLYQTIFCTSLCWFLQTERTQDARTVGGTGHESILLHECWTLRISQRIPKV